MAGVVLKFPKTGAASLSVALPFPAHSQAIPIEPNQRIYRAPAGNIWTAKIGPTIFQVTRKFEALNEAEVAALFAFLVGVKFTASEIRYCYTDSVSGQAVEIPCRLIEAPNERVVHIQNRDVTLKFEQFTHPDAATETE